MINIIFLNKHLIALEGMKAFFVGINDIRLEISQKYKQLVQNINKYKIFIIDVNIEDIKVIDLVKEIKSSNKHSKVILYTDIEVWNYYNLILEKKIDGLLSSNSTKEQVIQTIYAVNRGEILLNSNFIDYINDTTIKKQLKLSKKEISILELVAKGYTNKAIALELSVSQRTVENYLSKLFYRLNSNSRVELIVKAKEIQLIN